MLDGEACGCGAGAHAQLAVDGVEVTVDGVGADEEFTGYLGVGEAAGDAIQDLGLSGAQARRYRVV